MILPYLIKLSDVYDGTTNCITDYWTIDQSMREMPWKDTLLDGQFSTGDLDVLILTKYGDFYVSAFVRKYIKIADGALPLPFTQAKYISGYLYRKLFHTLRQEALALGADYNPISNYDMTEGGTDTHTHSGTDTTTSKPAEYESTTENEVYGFDSSTASDSDRSTQTLTQGTNPGEVSLVHGHIETIGHSLTRSGNIGVTTSQQMIQSELELRMQNYWDRAAKHIADVLTIPY